MGRVGLTREDVFAACEAIVARSANLTAMAVRETLGTGSFSTLLPWITEYRAGARSALGTPEGAANPSSLEAPAPASIASLGSDFVERVWREAAGVALSEIQAAANRSAVEIQLRDTQIQEKSQELEQVREELRQAQERTREQEREIDTLWQTSAQRSAESALLMEQAREKEAELQKLRSEKEAAVVENRELKQHRDRMTLDTQELKDALEKTRREIQDIEAKRASSEQERAGTREQLVRLETQLETFKVQWETTKSRNERLEEQLFSRISST